ncbi:MAG: radical SAM protein [Methanocellales archaeon]
MARDIIESYEDGSDIVFVLRNTIDIRINKKLYQQLSKKHDQEEILSKLAPRSLRHHITQRELVYVTKESGIPLIGHTAFGLIDRGTNVIQVRPISGCNLNCIFCSVDEGKSRTRVTDYIVEVDYLVEEFAKLVKLKGASKIEAHIDGQGEPFLYPYMIELIDKLARIKGVEVISAQTNGIPITSDFIEKVEGKLTRLNLSINSLDEKLAKVLAGTNSYDLEHVKQIAIEVARSKIDLLLAPIWVPNWNDGEIERIIGFGLKIGAGKRYPAFGVQKYIKYPLGRKPRGIKIQTFKQFYSALQKLESKYGVKLILKKEDFGIHKRAALKRVFRNGEILELKIMERGRVRGEMLAIARDRVIQVINTNKQVNSRVRVKIVRSKDNIYVAEQL